VFSEFPRHGEIKNNNTSLKTILLILITIKQINITIILFLVKIISTMEL
jgi:hypothetical protein